VLMKTTPSPTQLDRPSEAGFSLPELLIVLVMIIMFTCFVGLRITWAQQSLRLTNSAQILSSYVERARLAAIRCHCTSTLQIINGNGYALTGYLNGASVETLSRSLEKDVQFGTVAQTITFDWRGRTDKNYPVVLQTSRENLTVTIAGGGDTTISSNADYTYKPTINAALPTDLTDLAADSYLTSIAPSNSNSSTPVAPPPNPKNHKKPKK